MATFDGNFTAESSEFLKLTEKQAENSSAFITRLLSLFPRLVSASKIPIRVSWVKMELAKLEEPPLLSPFFPFPDNERISLRFEDFLGFERVGVLDGNFPRVRKRFKWNNKFSKWT